MPLARRSLLKAGFGFAAAGMAFVSTPLAFADTDPIGDLLAASTKPSVRKLAFDNLHTGETLDVAYWENGAYVPQALDAVKHVLRDHRNNEEHEIHPALLDLLTALSHRMETGPRYEVISGYRSPSTNALLHARSSEVAQGSLHMYGEAIDIRMAGRDVSYIRDAALSLDMGGVGYYPTSDFVHVDVGRVREWRGT
jgi:uncharacterized protein YcbK (DUF882 family)